MNTYERAKHELKLARENEIAQCKKNENYQPGDEDYGIMCYNAAEQLLAVFQEQGHSGYSAMVVCSIFEHLVKGKPLTFIKDDEDQWCNAYTIEKFPEKRYQHKRMSSLFKHVKPDGAVAYYDIDRIRIYDQNGSPFSSSTHHIDDVVSEYFPITFPYIGEEVKVHVEEFDSNAGYPNIRHIIDATRNGLDHVIIDRYFMFEEDYTWQEIDEFIYNNIKTNILKSEEENKNG